VSVDERLRGEVFLDFGIKKLSVFLSISVNELNMLLDVLNERLSCDLL
jgi:hypothetical protein